METGIELVVRVLVGGAAIRPSVGRPPTTCCCQSLGSQISALTISSRGSGWPALSQQLGDQLPQLPRDRRRCLAQLASDLLDAQARVPQVSDLDPLVLGHEPAADLTRGQPVQRRHEPVTWPCR